MAYKTAHAQALAGEDQLNIGRQRIQQVFKYLQALHEHRNPAKRQIDDQPWRLWLDSLPDHSAIVRHYAMCDAEADTQRLEGDEFHAMPILSVDRPKLTEAPPPPEELRDWLKPGWEKPESQCDHVPRREQPDRTGKKRIVQFEEDPARVELFSEWSAQREVWQAHEMPARSAMKVFEQLYELHGQMERESERYELVIGDGIVSWQLSDGGIFHPVLVRLVQLEFDAHIPRFRIVDLDKATELYAALFSTVPDMDGQSLARCRTELEQGGYHLLASESNAFLKRLAVALSPRGTTIDGRPDGDAEYPTIGRAPVLFLRSRAQSFAGAIEQLLSSLDTRTDLPGALFNIVGVDTTSSNGSADSDREHRARPRLSRREILFSKKANQQQEEIVQRLEQHSAVLVQGPPGTGKSHTIANLIGHLLANGKRILVTSHTTKALRVLRGHVVEQLRPLCVSVLESDSESRDQLRESVQGISQRLDQADQYQLMQEAELLAVERDCLYDQLERLKTRLQNALKDEYRNIVIGGTEYSPKEAAKKVADGVQKHDWIPGPVALGEPLPLSVDEVRELYATNIATTPDDDAYADQALPPLQSLPKPDTFLHWLSRDSKDKSRQKSVNCGKFWASQKFKRGDIKKFEDLKQRFEQLVESSAHLEDWHWAAVRDGRSDDTRAIWDELLLRIDQTKAHGEKAEHVALKFAPDLGDGDRLAQKKVLNEISSHLQSRKTLGGWQLAFHPSWKRAIKGWHVQRAAPSQPEHFAALATALDAEISRGELASLWDGLIGNRGGKRASELGPSPERYCAQQSNAIRRLLEWWQTNCEAAIEELKSLGFRWDVFMESQDPCPGEFGELHRVMNAIIYRLIPVLDSQINRLHVAYGKQVVEDAWLAASEIDRPEARALCSAIDAADGEAYRSAFDAITAATNRQKAAVRRQLLLEALKRPAQSCPSIAGAWADEIRLRTGVHGQPMPPGNVAAAWEWRQLNDELERRGSEDIEQLGDEIENLTSQLELVTAELIDRRAWAGQLKRTSLRQRQSLMGWLQAVRRIGKGYGQRAAKLRREAQQMMNDCQDAVPVWIMPLARVVDSFDFSRSSFDVVFIDEASQCDAMALIVLGIARSIVVVGDNEQVSPLAVGQDLATVEKLIGQFLRGIPGAALYDGKQSIYDIAHRSFGNAIRLIEHFRCVPDIIQFSNHLSYNGEIQPLRDENSSHLLPHVVPYRVEAAGRDDDVNHEEAIAIASLIAAAIEHPAYARQSFGAITLMGENQALEIQKLLLAYIDPEEIERRRILCGNPAQFQGDERDVIFLSVVDIPGEKSLSVRQQDLFKQRYNVAASRARNQMWVVYSLDPKTDLQEADLRRRLIEHALDPKSLERQWDQSDVSVESEFERLVARRLVEACYRVVHQWKVGRHRIDLVVQDAVDPKKRLAIECDGDRFHPVEKLAEDMERQAILERLGWRFLRIRGTEFFRNPDATMQRVMAKLDAMGIRPYGIAADYETSESLDSEVADALVRRAAEIREVWRSDERSEN
jgi:very-short-patch-repair endonuclease